MITGGESLFTAALFPLGLLFVTDGPTSYIALGGVIATLAAGLVGRYLDQRKDDRRHEWERQERIDAAKAVSDELVAHRTELTEAIAEHTATASAQVEAVRSTLSQENTEAAQHVKTVNDTVNAIQIKQTSSDQNELFTRVEIGKLIHDLFNLKHLQGEPATADSLTFQAMNRARIKELTQDPNSPAVELVA